MSKTELKGCQCLVTGGASNLGVALVELLLKKGALVTVFVHKVKYSGEGNVKSIVGDICSREDVEKATKGIHTVFHLASVVDIRPVPSPSMRRTNVDGTKNVIECCQRNAVRALVYTSSMEAVAGYGADGKAPDYRGLDDETLEPPAGHYFLYGVTKAEAEQMVLSANSASLATCALRPGYIVGPGCIGMKIEMENTLSRSNYYIGGKMDAKLNCVHPANCAVAHVLAAEKINEAAVQGHAFFISDFHGNVAEMNMEAFEDTGIKTILLPMWFAYAMAWVLDRWYRWIHAMLSVLGIAFEVPKTVVDVGAVSMAWRNLCFSTKRAQDVLGYEASSCGLFSRQETMEQTKLWAKKFHANLKASKGRNKSE